jgi:uncharacterized protein YdeI (YjbR/CyaY-like superfamily)
MGKNTESVPEDLAEALAQVPAAAEAWGNLTPIGRRDFIAWIENAKQEATRAKRIQVACDKLIKGQRRPCCYAVVPMDLYRVLGDNPGAKAQWSKLSADEKRDFSDWVESSSGKEERKERVAAAAGLLVSGKRQPE